MTQKIHIASYRLAAAYGHGWADHIRLDSQWEYDIPDQVISSVVSEMDTDDSTIGPGIYPCNTHRTGSGRVEWETWSRSCVIRICRSDKTVGGLGGGSVVVLSAEAELCSDGLIEKITLRESGLAEARHWREMFTILQVLGLEHCGSNGADDAWSMCVRRCLELHDCRSVPGWSELVQQRLDGTVPDCDIIENPSPLLYMPVLAVGATVMQGEHPREGAEHWNVMDAIEAELHDRSKGMDRTNGTWLAFADDAPRGVRYRYEDYVRPAATANEEAVA